MAKGNEDAVLRIRAKNLASKELREVRTELDGLTASQEENADATKLAVRSLSDLKTELRNLRTIEKELSRRAGLAEKLKKDKAEIGATQAKLRGLTAELERLNALKTANIPVKGLNREISKTENAIKATNKRLSEQVARFKDSADSAKKLGINAARTAESIQQINDDAARTAALTKQAEEAMNGYSVAVRASEAALREQQASQRAITEEAQRRMALEEKAQRQFREDARERLQETIRIEKKRADAIHAFSAGPTGVTFGPGNKQGLEARDAALSARAAEVAAAAAAREEAFRNRLITVLRRQKDGGEKLLAMDGQLAAASRKVAAALDKQAGSMDRTHRLGGLLADTGRKSLSVYQRLRGQILATAAAYVGLYQAVNLVQSAVTVEQERRRIEIQLRIANKGDVAQSKKDVEFLRAQADRLGLVYEDLAKNFANFKIAGQAVGLTNRTINKSFLDATEIVTGLGLSAEDADGVFRAFVQILGKARVQAEELRGQLGDRLPGAVAQFAKSINLPLSQLDAYLKKGKGNIQNFLTFLHDYAENTKTGVEENSRTLFAQFNRLKNAYRDFLADFAKGGVSTELLKIVNQLITKLKGEEGAKFAKELSDAFVVVGKVLLFVIDNFDKFITLLKLYLGLQAAKAVTSLGVSLLSGGYQALKFVTNMLKLNTALRAAKVAGAALTLEMRLLALATGPIGIAITAAAAAIYLLGVNSRKAEAEIDGLIETSKRMRTLQGSAGVQGIRNAAAQIRDLGKEEAELLKKRKALEEQQGTKGLAGAPDPLAKLIDAAADTTLSLDGVNQRLKQVQSNIKLLKTVAEATGKRLVKEANAAAEAARKEAEAQDKLDTAKPPEDADAAAKKAEAAAKAAEVLAEKRHDITERSARELLDIEKALAEARVAAHVSSQEQIDANLKASLEAIGAETEKRRNELEALKHDAERIKAPEAAATAQAAIDKLPQLQKELETKAKIEATTDSIALGEQKINDLIAARDAEIETINTRVELGLLSEVDGRQAAIDKQMQYKEAIVSAITAFAAQLEALKASDPDLAKALHVDELIEKLGVAKLRATEVVTTTQLIAKNLGGQLSAGVTSFFSTFIKGALGAIEGVNGIAEAFKNAKDGFLNFLADFLVGIGEAILKAILLQAIMNAINGTKGGYFSAAVGALTGHTGGVVRGGGIGQGNPVRNVSTALFAGAERFHGGGMPGLKANEVPAILKKREEVLTEDDPRNVLNGGLSVRRPGLDRTTIINAIDSRSMFEAGANTRSGDTVFYNFIRANKRTVRKLLGI